MSCEYRLDELRLCAILDIECNNPEKNNPDNYNIETECLNIKNNIKGEIT